MDGVLLSGKFSGFRGPAATKLELPTQNLVALPQPNL